MYAPGIDLGVIEAVKRAVSIPVIGNGDVTSAADAMAMMRKTGCDGVMIGRGAMGNPWIFAELSAAMEGREYSAPSAEERLEVALSHLDGMLAHKGERVGFAEAKKHMSWYLTGLRGAASARAAVMTAEDPSALREILRALFGGNG